MPVNVLYCEGDDQKSLDAQILRKIVPANCFIKPIGSKHGFIHRIVGAREAQPHKIVAGIKDRDFDDNDATPTNTPYEWYATINNKRMLLGWYWERKEIENYLIDPEVVKHALGSKAPPLSEYKAVLQKSASMIANYTAARMALSSISYPNPHFNYWGDERELGYFFPKDKGLKEPESRSQITRILTDKKKEMADSKIDVLEKFDQFLENCKPSGKCFEHYLTFFAGKDLLYMMRHQLKLFGFKDSQQPACYTFRDAIIRGIRYSPEDVWTWLPEWQKLRELLGSTVL